MSASNLTKLVGKGCYNAVYESKSDANTVLRVPRSNYTSMTLGLYMKSFRISKLLSFLDIPHARIHDVSMSSWVNEGGSQFKGPLMSLERISGCYVKTGMLKNNGLSPLTVEMQERVGVSFRNAQKRLEDIGFRNRVEFQGLYDFSDETFRVMDFEYYDIDYIKLGTSLAKKVVEKSLFFPFRFRRKRLS